MNSKDFNKGLGLTALGSFWWGVVGVVYFEYISFIGYIEAVLHRCIWTSFFFNYNHYLLFEMEYSNKNNF